MSIYAIVSKIGNVLLIKDSITNLWECPGIPENDKEKLIEYLRNTFQINATLGECVFSRTNGSGNEVEFYEVSKITGKFSAPNGMEIRWADVTLFDRLDIKIDHKLAILKAHSHKLFG